MVEGGTLPHILDQLDSIMVWVPLKGYFQDPNKSIFVISEENLAQAESFFRWRGTTIVKGGH